MRVCLRGSRGDGNPLLSVTDAHYQFWRAERPNTSGLRSPARARTAEHLMPTGGSSPQSRAARLRTRGESGHWEGIAVVKANDEAVGAAPVTMPMVRRGAYCCPRRALAIDRRSWCANIGGAVPGNAASGADGSPASARRPRRPGTASGCTP